VLFGPETTATARASSRRHRPVCMCVRVSVCGYVAKQKTDMDLSPSHKDVR
jgi:hypothetical protein